MQDVISALLDMLPAARAVLQPRIAGMRVILRVVTIRTTLTRRLKSGRRWVHSRYETRAWETFRGALR
jgi:predicted nucleotidyltransferase